MTLSEAQFPPHSLRHGIPQASPPSRPPRTAPSYFETYLPPQSIRLRWSFRLDFLHGNPNSPRLPHAPLSQRTNLLHNRRRALLLLFPTVLHAQHNNPLVCAGRYNGAKMAVHGSIDLRLRESDGKLHVTGVLRAREGCGECRRGY